jgi:Raf kinase inhibitor-like YbhB/YbcL family protein
MKTIPLIIVCTILAIAAVISVSLFNRSAVIPITIMSSPHSTSMKLESPAFAAGGVIPVKYTCNGNGVSPPLDISGVPAGAKSLVITMEDPDASVGIWDHWVAFNIDPKTSIIVEGAASTTGVLGSNTSGTAAYESPCPPSGIHRYVFTLYALSITLSLPEGSSKNVVTAAMNGNVLAMAELVGRYGK